VNDIRWTLITEDKNTCPKLGILVMFYSRVWDAPIIKIATHRDVIVGDELHATCWRYLDMGDYPPTWMTHTDDHD
jgi:hypothetical protein